MDKKIGILGGGQLGKMLLQYCSRLSLKTSVYDPSDNSPCKNLCDTFYKGSLTSYDEIVEFGRKCDILTYEIEHINVEALKTLENEGIQVYPQAKTLETIQNKNTQKCFFKEKNIPTSNFKYYENLHILKQQSEDIIFPCVWKKTTFGYDGFGVKVLKSLQDLDSLDQGECIIEDLVDIEQELSVIVARNKSGEYRSYPPVEMIFNQKSNQVEYVIEPAQINYSILKKVNKLADIVSENLDHVGLLAIEMFVSKNGEVLINELAPRPHNSGHLTLEPNCLTSQFEQHIRSILDLPLGDTTFTQSSIMLNIVGPENKSGKAKYVNVDKVFDTRNTYLHIYGKEETRPNRKMGHITIVGCNDKLNRGKDRQELLDKAKMLKDTLQITV